MDQDQMELEFPPEILAACAQHGLGVYMISNDIPARDPLIHGLRFSKPRSTFDENDRNFGS
jgi:hypothetical protein